MKALNCSNPDCRVSETGKCVEGFSLGECPHQTNTAINASPLVIDDTDTHQHQPSERIVPERSIARGEILNIDEATDILRSGPTRVMALIGPMKSGKTTFGISLYDAFQNSTFDRWSFSGSMTLPAFEKRCHLSRFECGRSTPDTVRTSLSDGLGFLHIAVHCNESGRINLLISDRSGEFYTDIADNRERCDDLHEVLRADLVLFLIDGEKLASDERHGVINDVRMLITTLMEGNILTITHRVGIVLTKYDLVLASIFKERVEKDFAGFVTKIVETYGADLEEIKPFKISARSENEDIASCYGILDILEETLRDKNVIKYISTSIINFDRSFLRLQEIGRRTE
jgi:hypothetical protein